MTVQIEKRGEFATFQAWVNNATFCLGGNSYTCVDTKGRVCHNGGDMQRAHDEGAFPVSFGPRLDKVKRLVWSKVGDYPSVTACEFVVTIIGHTLAIYREQWDGTHTTIFAIRTNTWKHAKSVARKWLRKRGVLEDKAVRT